MIIRTTTDGEDGLPRYFAQVFATARGLRHGRLDLVPPDARRFRAEGAGPGPVAKIAIHAPDLLARLIREGDFGFCEGYAEDWWSIPDLQAFVDLVHAGNEEVYDGFPGMRALRLHERFRFWLPSNSRRQVRRDIRRHDDLGDAVYGLWLDDTMTHSSMMSGGGQDSLEAEQRAKYAGMIDGMAARSGDRVLEIGCGWGGFAEFAARERDLRVTALAIGREQHDFAVERIARAGLSDRIEIRMRDERDERGIYDGVASIEMFEAVGRKYWPVSFEVLRERLRPGRNAARQVITVEDRRWDRYRRGRDLIQKHIFPGGMLPSPAILRSKIARAGLRIARSIEFGQSDSRTLRRWFDTFATRWNEVSALGFGDRVRRVWNVCLTSCAAAFRSGNRDVTQITATRPA